MIELTTNANLFWEQVNKDSPAIIYGTGANGELIGKMLNNAEIPFNCYLDIKANANDPRTLLGKKIFNPYDIMQNFHPKKYCIVITALAVLECVMEIEANIENAIVLIPHQLFKGYDFDYMFGFCRHKLLKKNDFTIISNNCLGGRFYGITNSELKTPTINTIIEPEDYVKFCSNLKHYLSKKLEFVEYSNWRYNRKHPIGKIGDIKIHFIAYTTFEEAEQAWERRKTRVNYDNLFMIFDSSNYQPTLKQSNNFLNIPIGKKLIVQRNIAYYLEHSITTNPGFHPFDENRIIEEYFDLTGWLNGEVEY